MSKAPKSPAGRSRQHSPGGGRSGGPTPGSGVSRGSLEALMALRHPDPHAVLGPHPAEGGVVVRALRPEAGRVTLRMEGGGAHEMTRIADPGVFEAFVPEAAPPLRYRLEVAYPDGGVYTLRDPYAFGPTLGELDLYLFGEGRHEQIYDVMGAHVRELEGVRGVSFAVWAPGAHGVSVVGEFNSWDGRLHPMRHLGHSGVWELFVPELEPGTRYKYELRTEKGWLLLKADPYANQTEMPPGTASVVHRPAYRFGDADWRARQNQMDPQRRPISIYEVHLGSWRHAVEEGDRPLSYRELAGPLADYVEHMGFTHVQMLPVMEHPFGGSWGYQVSGYYAPTARFGAPDDLRHLIDHLHRRGIGVILDWVPAHFPKDVFTLGRFDGTALYEHLDPRQGEHPDWGTYVFNYSRNEVRNFLLGSALYWLSAFHVDGLRLDAVAAMLYLDYSRREGEWVPNVYGGRENLDAISLLKELNIMTHSREPGVLMMAEESTAWPGVSRPTYTGGLGFGFKWNMGWMHDTLQYFSRDPVHRRYHHNNLTFGLLYAFTEHFVLPLSHDEVVHGKGSLIDKMPGDRWQKFANLRALYGYMWAHPGRQLLFMGGEFGQWREWNHNTSLDWHLLDASDHHGLQTLVRDLNHAYRDEPVLWEADSDPESFRWIDAQDADGNVIAFRRIAPASGRQVVCVCNFSPVARRGYRIGLPRGGFYREMLNTDSARYGGGNVGNMGGVQAEARAWHGLPWSAGLTLPPLATVWLDAPEPS